MNTPKKEISILKFKSSEGEIYKVTRKFLVEGTQDTRFFKNKKDAEKQLRKWER